MSHCTTSSCSEKTNINKYRCPANGKQYTTVLASTIQHHINQPWAWRGKQQAYFFCDDPECEVVYFGEDDSVINKTDLRTIVGVKEKSDDALICYCFGVTKTRAKDNKVKTFVMNKTKQHVCACEVRNPSGRCCLKDFPKHA